MESPARGVPQAGPREEDGTTEKPTAGGFATGEPEKLARLFLRIGSPDPPGAKRKG
jgi:hypothetical protein